MDGQFQILSEDYPKILFIKGEQNARYPYSNSLLIDTYLIDTGASTKRLRKVKKIFPIQNVILSHWHEDHIHGNRIFKNAQFLSHINDKPIIEDISKMIPYYNLENDIMGSELRKLLDYLRCEDTKVSTSINDNEIIKLNENLELKVLFTPGHTAGHCAFIETNSKIGFFGDIDLSKLPYYGNTDANLMEFEKSIDRLVSMDFDIAVTGHKGPFFGKTNIREELRRYKEILMKRDEEILSYFKEKKEIILEDLKRKHVIYKKYMFEEFEIIAELLMIQKHIEKFLQKDIIMTKEKGFVLK